MMKVKMLWKQIAVTGLVAVMVTGCGSTSVSTARLANTESANYDYAASGSNDVYSYDYDSESYATTEEAAEYEEESSGVDSAEIEEGAQAQSTERKLIKNVDMTVETEEFDSLLANVQNRIEELGGYVENSNVYNGSNYYDYADDDYSLLRSANITARIPADKLDEFLTLVSDTSNVISKTESVTDVTLQYVDLQSHKDALETEQQRLLELLEQAETVEDIISLESRLSEVRYQIESMESQLRTYDNQVSYSTVYLSIDEVKTYTQTKEQSRIEKMTSGFMDSLQGVGNGFLDLCVKFVVAIPYIVVWAIVIIIVILLIRLIWKRSQKGKAKRLLKKQKKEAERQAAYDAHRQSVAQNAATTDGTMQNGEEKRE